MAQLPPGGTGFDGGDPVVWAKLVPGGQDHTDNHRDGLHSYRETWLVYLSGPNVSPAQIRASKRIPAEGFPLYQHEPATDPTLLGTYMRADGPVVRDVDAVVVNRDVKKDGDPYYAEVVVSYEGVEDPTAEPPDAQEEYITFQEHLTFDVNGKPVMNTAFDPIDGGMPSEGFLKRITITRNLVYSAWHMKQGDAFIKTLNSKDFALSGQFEDDGVTPVKYPLGYCLIDNIRTQRMPRARGVGTANTYYWRVTADLLVDLRTIRRNDGTRVGRLHRYVVPDAGYQAFKKVEDGPPEKWAKRQIKGSDSHPVSQPQLLDGKGRVLVPKLVDAIGFNAHLQTSALGGLVPDFYACEGGSSPAAFVVSDDNGVMANDTDLLVTSVVAVNNPSHSTSFTLNTGGGFSYTPAADFVGWDSFTYKPTGALDAAKQTCQILVGASPVLLYFDAYRYADWSGLAVLLEGW